MLSRSSVIARSFGSAARKLFVGGNWKCNGSLSKVQEIVATLKEYGIRTCYYGHLHGNAIRYAVQGEVDGIRYKLVSADGLRFCPYRIN